MYICISLMDKKLIYKKITEQKEKIKTTRMYNNGKMDNEIL